MASRKVNVLVYTGDGASLDSVRQCIDSLRRLLSPNYAVLPIAEGALLREPWAPTAALLVFPGGADLGYCRSLDGDGNRRIADYVRRGGSYLGFCAGGYYGSRRCEFEVDDPAMKVVGPRELAFFPGTCRGCAFPGFAYRSEKGARAVAVELSRAALGPAAEEGEAKDENRENMPNTFRCYYNGGGVFVDADAMAGKGVEVLARYADPVAVESGAGAAKAAAVVYCRVGGGAAVLTGLHPEFAAANLSRHLPDVPDYGALVDALAADDGPRTTFLKACLTKLGLEVARGSSAVPSLSKLHLSSLHHIETVELVQSLGELIVQDKGEEFIRGENDLFHLERPDSHWSLADLSEALLGEMGGSESREPAGVGRGSPDPAARESSKIPKRIVMHEDAWPELKDTPCFNHSLFYSSLAEFRERDRGAAEVWGNTLMYGEVVSSTNTLLEKNASLLAKLPTGFTMTATTQVAGRGRGSNVWVSPAGSLIMSTVINHPGHLVASRPVVFMPYLAAIAVAEAVRTYGASDADPAYSSLPVRLKWPNDIYARDPATGPGEPDRFVKIGGILANCAYAGDSYQVVLGIGINTTNGRPTTSLDALLPAAAAARAPAAETRRKNETGSQQHQHQQQQQQQQPQPPEQSSTPGPFRIERLVARILTRLEALYGEFCRVGFSPELERQYYSYWLHSGQVVTLEAEGGARARVLGITRDWGMLKVEEVKEDSRGGSGGGLVPTGKVWVLQSDENSFDFWKGLVKRKL